MRIAYLSVVTLVVLLRSVCVWGQSAEDELTRTEELERVVAQQDSLIQQMSRRLAELESRILTLESQGDTDPATTAVVQVEEDIDVADTLASVTTVSEDERREQERLVRAAFQQTLIERGGLLLPPGVMDVEPSMSYLHSSSDNIVIDGFTILPVLVVGDIVSERVHRELMQVSTTVRIGLPWQSQLDVRVPYSYHMQRRFSADNMEQRISSSGLGDIDIGWSRQITRNSSVWPDLLGSVRYKSRTGSNPFRTDPDIEIATGAGFDSLNLAFTGVKVVDPVVYFGSLSYSRNLARDIGVGRYDPGDSLGFSLGMAIALNLNSSLSLAYDQQRTKRAHINNIGIPGTYLTTGIFSVGASFAVGDRFTTDLSLGIGTTADSPDVQIQASFPVRLRR
jgi:hypothetical protein